MKNDKFGLLFAPIHINIPDRLTVYPTENYFDIISELKDASVNGFIYPPFFQNQVSSSNIINITSGMINDRYHLPSTHIVEYSSSQKIDEFREGAGRLMLGLLSVLYNSRLQWDGIWSEDRIPTINSLATSISNGRTYHLGAATIIQHDQLSEFISNALRTWDGLNKEARQCILNALFFHQKAIAYKWEFEQFSVNFFAVDAIWRFGTYAGLWDDSHATHCKRLAWMAHILNIYPFPVPQQFENCVEIKRLCEIRSNLMQDAKWCSGNPEDIFYKDETGNVIYIRDLLHRLMKRLIIAALGIQNEFTRSPWDKMIQPQWDSDSF